MMRWFAKRQLRERQPSQKTMDAVAACLTELGFGRDHLVEEFAEAVARKTQSASTVAMAHNKRCVELLEANNELVFRNRDGLQAMRGMLTYAEQYAPDALAPLKAIVAANKINL